MTQSNLIPHLRWTVKVIRYLNFQKIHIHQEWDFTVTFWNEQSNKGMHSRSVVQDLFVASKANLYTCTGTVPGPSSPFSSPNILIN
jgi:hypothetical protein